ncbi:hypothetical protein PSET11_02334 [Arthrobacter ulcerisalmonis]|uniref:Uncharacterized protein n=1 Tax=Arthrobacter ulcerisalmonis TaxID=2483813 RepID=A0A3P5XQ51_9MICC|nr:hypothetical protein PSET11_02334 [Arthrobacter ulcerisalmonis]
MAVRGGPGRGDQGPVSCAGERAGVGGEFSVHGGPVFGAEAGCFPDEECGAPFVEVPGVEGGEGVGHFGDEGSGEAKEPAAAAGGFTPGQCYLGTDAVASLGGGHPGRGLGCAFEGVERDGQPGLEASGRGLQIFEAAELINQPSSIRSGPNPCHRHQ